MIFFNITWLKQPNGGDDMKVIITKGPMFETNVKAAQKYLCEVLMKEINQSDKKEKVS